MVKKSLSVRTHKCSCGFVANRDYNAALNILRIGLDALAGQPAYMLGFSKPRAVTAIYPHVGSGRVDGRPADLLLHLDGYKPVFPLPGNCGVFRQALDLPAFDEPDPADLRQVRGLRR
ncbi:MAG: zinc ribbon domain-containing protein [Pseudomonadota bacterium]